MSSVTRVVSFAASACVLSFSARRLLLGLAAALPPRQLSTARGQDALPQVAILMSAHEEENSIDRLLAGLAELDYPVELLSIVLASDGSRDGTSDALTRFAAERPHAEAVLIKERGGKARALNRALAESTGEVVVVFDADSRPCSEFLRCLVKPFADASVAGATGVLQPDNAAAGPVARYAATEAWVHQLVTSAGKDRLGLDPPLMGGACAYRRSALETAGGFRPDAMTEDTEAMLAFEAAGWRTRLVPNAVARSTVVDNLGDYWRQHVRWSRGRFDAASRAPLAVEGSLLRTLERLAYSAGYLDRAAFIAACALLLRGGVPRWVPATYLLLPAAHVVLAVVKAGATRDLPAYLLWASVFFPVDVLASIAAAMMHLRRRPREWRSPQRSG